MVVKAMWIVLFGMAIIFLVLVILWGVMVLFNRLFKPATGAKDKS